MKKFFLFLFFGFLFVPLNVFATDVDLSLECPKSAKQGATITCDIKAKVSNGTLVNFSALVNADDDYFAPSSQSFNDNTGWNEGSVKIGSFKVAAKSKVGSGTISLSSFDGEDADGNNATFSLKVLSSNIKILDNDSSLTDIKVDGATLQGFNPTTTKYSLNVEKDSINIEAKKPSSAKSVTNTGKKTLQCGANSIKLVVTAEDNSTNTYTLNVNRSCSSNDKLKGITLSSGALSPAFDANTKEYTVNVSTDIATISITGVKADSKQKIEGNVNKKELKYGSNNFNIVVTSESGIKNTYKIVVNREDGRNDNNYLTSLTLSDGRLDFDRETTTYNTKVLYEVTNVTVEAVAEATTSKIEVKGGKNLKVGENTIVVTVTSEKGAKKDYTIVVNRLNEGETLGDNPNIASITISGYDLGFTSDVTDYNLKIEKEDSLDISVVMEDSTSNYSISGNEKLKDKSIIRINTTSADGSKKEYTITIEKNDIMLYLLLAGGAVVIALILIIVLAIKSKKKKKEEDKNKKVITTAVAKDKELISKVESQLKSAELMDKNKPEENNQTNIVSSTNPTNTNTNANPNTNAVGQINTNLSANNASTSNKTIVQPSTTTTPLKKENNEVKPQTRSARIEEDEEEKEEATKICTICGHRVLASAKVCPYCKRTW